MSVGVNIVSQFDSKGIDKAVRDFQKLNTNGERAGFALKKAMLPALAVIGGIAAGLGFAAKAAIEDEKSQSMLAKQMESTTGATELQIKSMEEYITKLTRVAAVADDVIRPAMATLVRSTRSVTEAQKLMTLALDVSAATGKDLETVSLTLGKAFNGNFTALKKLDPAINGVLKSTSSWTDANNALTRSFGGAAATAAGTTAGKFAMLKITMDETKESIGRALIPVIEKLVGILQPMAFWAEKNSGALLIMTGFVGAIAVAILAANVAMKAWNAIAIITKGINYALATSFTAVQIASGAIIVTGVLAAVGAGVWGLNRIFRDNKKVVEDSSIAMGTFVNRMSLAARTAYQVQYIAKQLAAKAAFIGPIYDPVAIAAAKALKEGVGGAAKAVESLAKALKEKLGNALDDAKGALKTAQDAFTSFADKVSSGLTNAFSFADAQDAGAETGGGFLAGLRAQVAGITGYTDKVAQLLEMHLSQESLAAVLAAGQVAGTKIADQLIAGGQSAIDDTNALVASMNTAADKVGIGAAGRWYQSGIDNAVKMVAGLQAEIDRLTPKIMAKMDALAAKMKRTIDIDVNVTERVNKIISNISGGATKLAAGGIVTRPTFAMVGEAGPEAVIPLNRAGDIGGGDTIINLTVNTLTADEKFAEFTVDRLRDLVRRKGSLKLLTT